MTAIIGADLRLFVLRLSAALALAALAGAPYALAQTVHVPFVRDGEGHVVIPVTVDGATGYAGLDNGAGVSVIDLSFAEEHGLVDPLSRALKPLTGSREAGRRTQIGVGELSEEVIPRLIDLGGMIGPKGEPIIALVGEEFFKRHIVEVSFSTSTVTFEDASSFHPPRDLAPFRLKSGESAKARIPVVIEGQKPVEAVLDLGSTDALMIAEGAATRRWLAQGRAWSRVTRATVHGDKMIAAEQTLFSASSLSLGGVMLSDVPANVVTERWFLAPSQAGLGVNVLSRFDLIFDIRHKRLWMRSNPSLEEPFRHMVAGLTWTLGDGEARVNTVYLNSPAQKAGLKAGDVVVRIDGVAPTLEALARRFEPGEVIELEMKDGSKRSMTAARFY